MTLYSPPTWDLVGVLRGSLTQTLPMFTTTYKLAGVWVNIQTPGVGETDAADYVFNTATVIDSGLAAEMQAADVPGDYT